MNQTQTSGGEHMIFLTFGTSLHSTTISKHYTTETCNTAMERKFCGLLGDVFKNCEKFFNEAKLAFFWITVNSDI